MKRRLLLLWLLLLAIPLAAEERADWGPLFGGVPGTMVVLRGTEWDIYDTGRANTGFIPASTFKIPHSLIALRTGALRDGHQILRWDGVERQYPDWNRDHTLRSAMKFSVVPVYQAFARSIGEANMKAALDEFGYGNAEVGGASLLDRFWLDGGLRISAVQQVQFLQRLHDDSLPVPLEHSLLVKDAMLTEANAQYVLRAKTGYQNGVQGYGDHSRPGIGWWVGWVELDAETVFFALNIDIAPGATEQLPLRQSIAREILRAEGVLPSP